MACPSVCVRGEDELLDDDIGAYEGLVSSRGGHRSGACTAVGQNFCEPGQAVTRTSWNFVGTGKGGYEKVQSYKYVGDGGGAFEQETVTTYRGSAWRKCCVMVLLLLALAGGSYYMAANLTGADPLASLESVVPADFLTDVWSKLGVDQPQQESVNASAPHAAAAHAKPLYDCAVNTNRDVVRMAHWSSAQRAFCCRTAKVGCGSATTPVPLPLAGAVASTLEGPFDCSIGVRTMWPSGKADWCCEKKDIGCPTTTTTPTAPPSTSTTSTPWDCLEGLDHWQKTWSVGKRDYCCRHEGRGCAATHDCQKDLSDFETKWSGEKRSWCCRHYRRGCGPPHSSSGKQSHQKAEE
jgi:hypothetical protein